MRESEITALISLLDDNDPQIESHVEERLLALGTQVIPKLEAAWEKEIDQGVQGRIEDLIQAIQSQNVRSNLLDWSQKGDDASLLEGWYLVTKYQYPTLEYETYYHAVSRLIHKIWLELSPKMNNLEKIRVISDMLYVKERFDINLDEIFLTKNYFLNGFVESKKGGPVSLGILYIIICQELKIPVYGIPIPGHFIMIYRDNQFEFFMDPANKGAIFAKNDLKRYLREINVADNAKYYNPVSNYIIIGELVRTLIFAFRQTEKSADLKLKRWEELLNDINKG